MFLSAGCSLLKAEGFSCRLDVLYEGLGMSILQFLKEKKSSGECFQIFGHQNPGSETGSGYGSVLRKNAGSESVSGSALNQC
jgi:hypothetical protein